jgi:hypothetical protein
LADKEIIRPPFRTECPGFTEGAFRFLQQVAQWINKLLTPPAWTGVASFSSSWVNYGGGFFNAAYCKDALGFVHLRGLIKDGTLNAVVFALPVALRPSSNLNIASVCSGASVATIQIQPGGNVYVYASSATWVSLDGITFYAG